MNVTLRTEEDKDFRTVENLTREAFWNLYRPGCSEHYILHKLRSSPAFIKELDLVAELGGEIVGNIVYSKAMVVDDAGTKREVIGFGPLSVLPSCQRQGIGAKLIEHTVAIAKEMGFKAIVIFGDPSFYHRFGFENADKFDIHTAEGENFEPFMVKELYAGSLQGITGRFFDDEAFHVNEDELDLYDKEFSAKEKKVTDTQLFK
jgi:predicted N-acetyltransferase YhbS